MVRFAYTPDELAERWGCSGNHIRAMIRKGTLPAFRLGKLYRVPASVVEEYEACENAPSPRSDQDQLAQITKEAKLAASMTARLMALSAKDLHDK